MNARPALTASPDNDFDVCFTFGPFTGTIDVSMLSEIDGEARLRIARAICWEETLRAAAERLTGDETAFGSGFSSDSTYGDQRDRLAFLDAVKHEADHGLRREVERLNARLADAEAQADRCWRALGGGSDNVDRHMRACDIRHGRA